METYRNMMDAAMEDTKARLMLADKDKKDAVEICAKVLHAEGTRAEQNEGSGLCVGGERGVHSCCAKFVGD